MKNRLDVRATYLTLWSLFLGAVGLTAYFGIAGPTTIKVLEGTVVGVAISLGLRLDPLSMLLLLMVTLLGSVIGHYSLRYLDGEERQGYFYRNLLFTIVAVSFLVLSSNLVTLLATWIASSLCLHRLLLYYPDRPAAVLAARKKFIISRMGDIALIFAIGLTYRLFHSFEFTEIFAGANAVAEGSPEQTRLALIGFLFAVGAMSKSAQFPFHFWLPETMETPTPVSALMHAGIINAGGFLIIRLSPLLQHSDDAHLFLSIMGAFTATFGGLVMITQNDIKKKLAYSTISQMGMMMFACGLGAYSVALFHIFAHSFYKAHAFLSTGQLVRESTRLGYRPVPPPAAMVVVGTAAGIATLVAGGMIHHGAYFAYFAYASVLFLGFLQNFGPSDERSYSRLKVLGRVAWATAIAIAAFTLIESTLNHRIRDLVPPETGDFSWTSARGIAGIASFVIFVAGFWIGSLLMRPHSEFMKRLYVFLWNGGYASARSTRFLELLSTTRP